jgi:hypothetical protein
VAGLAACRRRGYPAGWTLLSRFPALVHTCRLVRAGQAGRVDQTSEVVECAQVGGLDHGLDAAAFSDDGGGGLVVPGCLAPQFRKPHRRNPGRVVADRERAAARREVDRGGDSRVAVRLI